MFLEFKKTKIWTSATIIFHWFLAIGFSLTCFTKSVFSIVISFCYIGGNGLG